MGIGEVTKAVFLDRDGVLNRAVVRDGTPYPPATWTSWRSIPDAAEALAPLEAGGLSADRRHQPARCRARHRDARGGGRRSTRRWARRCRIDEFVVCAHDDAADCACRKPKPGMVLEAAARHAVDLRQSFLVGDRWRDVDCGASAGVRTVLIDRGYRERAPDHAPDFVADSLAAAADWILQR